MPGTEYPQVERRRVRVLEVARAWFVENGLRLAMVLVAGYVYVLRQPSVLVMPVFMGEDGTIFFKDAIERGAGAIFDPYNGQLFVFQRVVALLAAPFPVYRQPAVYALVAVATAVFCCSIALSSRWRYAVPLKARFGLAVALLCSPAVIDIFGTLLNAHWWLAVGLVLLGMLSDPLSRRLKMGELAFTGVAVLSGLSAIYALPTMALRAYRNRSRHSLALLGVTLGGGLVEIGYLLASQRPASGLAFLQHPDTALHVLVKRVFAESALGDANLTILWPYNQMPPTWLWLLPIAVFAVLAAVWVRAPRLEIAALLLALLGGWVLALEAVAEPILILQFYGRYFALPIAMLYVTLTVSWPVGKFRRIATGLAGVMLGTGILSGYRLGQYAPVDWASFAACMDHSAAATCSTTIDPGWTLEVTRVRH